MQFELLFDHQRSRALDENCLLVGTRAVPLRFIRHRRARRYVLRLCPDGAARVTVPRGGSAAEGKRFAQRNLAWLEKQLLRQALQPARAKTWVAGTEILFRGERVRLEIEPRGKTGVVRFGSELVRIPKRIEDLRPAIERHLWRLAGRELPLRVIELASLHGFSVRRVTVRNQRSRWGSCSVRGTISLNWRLIQTPIFVRDYIVLHELAHLKEMNHSPRYWREVARLCPEFAQAEKWLKQNSGLLSGIHAT
jgi:predicted metal-dependent hydrolase